MGVNRSHMAHGTWHTLHNLHGPPPHARLRVSGEAEKKEQGTKRGNREKEETEQDEGEGEDEEELDGRMRNKMRRSIGMRETVQEK